MQQLLKIHLDSTAGSVSGELFRPVPPSVPPAQCTFQSSYWWHLSIPVPTGSPVFWLASYAQGKEFWALKLVCQGLGKIKIFNFLKLFFNYFLIIKEANLKELAHTKQLRHYRTSIRLVTHLSGETGMERRKKKKNQTHNTHLFLTKLCIRMNRAADAHVNLKNWWQKKAFPRVSSCCSVDLYVLSPERNSWPPLVPIHYKYIHS